MNCKFVLFACIFILMTCTVRAQSDVIKESPNIIFILTDDLGYGDVSIYNFCPKDIEKVENAPHIHTPNLDEMAANGALFTDHYAAAPVCAPSRASILTGKSQGHASVRDNQFDKELTEDYTFATLLKAKGYRTAAIGKWGLQGNPDSSRFQYTWPAHPLEKGFDYFFGYMRHVDGHEHYPKEGIYRGRKIVLENNTDITQGLDRCYSTDLWTAAAKRWIRSVSLTHKPFCLYLAYDTPHAVLELPTSSYPAGGGLNGGIQWSGKKGHMINTATGTPDSYMHPEIENATYEITDAKGKKRMPWPDTYKRYATSVRRIDEAVGDIVQLLQDLGVAEQTLIVFTSDNGPSMESYLPQPFVNYSPDFFQSFGPFNGIKRDVLEGGIRVPLIAYWPGKIPRGTVVRKPSISYDWLPTFVNAAGLPVPAAVNGVSLLPILTGKGKQLTSDIYIEYKVGGKTPDYSRFSPNNRSRIRGQMQMLRIENLVGLRYNIKSAADSFEIYNIIQDKGQNSPLSDTDSLQEIMKSYAAQHRLSDQAADRPYDQVLIPANAVDRYHHGVMASFRKTRGKWLEKVDNQGAVTILRDLTCTLPVNDGQLSLRGYLCIPSAGNYRLSVIGTKLVTLKLHEIVCVDNDYHMLDKEKSVRLNLDKGRHRFSLDCEIENGRIPIKMMLQGEGQAPRELTAADFVY